jgi:hypothetical protein
MYPKTYFLFILTFWLNNSIFSQFKCDANCAEEIKNKICLNLSPDSELDRAFCLKIRIVYIIESKDASFKRNLGDPKINIDSFFVRRLEKELGENIRSGLAAVIGHELRHAEKGEIHAGFNPNPKVWKEHKLKEKDADVYGMLYAYAAGYKNVREVFPKVVNSLSPKSRNHLLSPEERRSYTHDVLEKAHEFILPFEIANYLPFINARNADYLEMAIGIYEGIEAEIGSFEQLKYAKGLAHLIYALSASESDNIYPIEIPSSDFLNLRRGDGRYSDEVKAALKEAKRFFEEVLKISPNDFDTHLALAATQLELGLSEEREIFDIAYAQVGVMRQLPKLQKNQLQKIDLMFALIKHNQQEEEGKKLLTGIRNNLDYPDNLRNIASLNFEEVFRDDSSPLIDLPPIDDITFLTEKNQDLDLLNPSVTLKNDYRLFFEEKDQSTVVRLETFFNTLIFQESEEFKSHVSPDFLKSMSPTPIGSGLLYFFDLKGGNGKVIVETNEKNEILTVKKLLIVNS